MSTDAEYAAKYPEHEKMKVEKAAYGLTDVASFLEWMDEQGWTICERDARDEYNPVEVALAPHREKLFAKYVGIDIKKIDDEKRAMLEECRAMNAVGIGSCECGD